MPTFKNKPRQIEAVELVPGVLMPEGVLVRVVRGGSPDAYEAYNALHDSWIKTKTGDMIRVDKAPMDVYPIDRATFDTTYEPATDGAPGGGIEDAPRTAFEAYNADRGGLTWDGKPIPGWSAVGDGVRAGWTAAARAVLSLAGFVPLNDDARPDADPL